MARDASGRFRGAIGNGDAGGGRNNGGERKIPSRTKKRNGTIQGGVKRKISAGDIIRIPAEKRRIKCCWDGGHEFTYFVVKVKGY